MASPVSTPSKQASTRDARAERQETSVASGARMMDHQQPPHQGGDGLLNLAPDDVAELLSPPAFAWSACSYTLTRRQERN